MYKAGNNFSTYIFISCISLVIGIIFAVIGLLMLFDVVDYPKNSTGKTTGVILFCVLGGVFIIVSIVAIIVNATW